METNIFTGLWTKLGSVAAIVLLSNFAHAAVDTNDGELRVSESTYNAEDGRKQSTANRISTDAFEPGTRVGRRSVKSTGNEQQKPGQAEELRTTNTDFWFYTADVELFGDADRDGYYHGIDLLFDVDTVYFSADVYAVVYLSLDGGPWLEYAETEPFAIYGATSDDEYVIVSELLAGYPSGSYDVLIELFDTWDHSFVADFGPEGTSELAFLPLEDSERDTPVAAPRPIVVSHGGGGAVDGLTIAFLLLLTASLIVRRRYRMRQLELRLPVQHGKSA